VALAAAVFNSRADEIQLVGITVIIIIIIIEFM